MFTVRRNQLLQKSLYNIDNLVKEIIQNNYKHSRENQKHLVEIILNWTSPYLGGNQDITFWSRTKWCINSFFNFAVLFCGAE